MSAEPMITLPDRQDSLYWFLSVQINGSDVVSFDDLGDGTFNIHHLDDMLASAKEALDTQNNDGQLRLRYCDGA
jgi:hypothetical protein